MFNPFGRRYWTTPPASILAEPPANNQQGEEYTIDSLAAIIAACGAPCTPVKVTAGASVIQYHFDLLNLNHYSKLNRISNALGARLHQNVLLSESTEADFSLTTGRQTRQSVPFKRVLLTHTFNDIKSPTAAILGTDSSGQVLAMDIAKQPHLLIAGATGSGKTVCVHSIIGSMLFKATPHSLNFLMIDPKQIELTMYGGLPHLTQPVITDVPSAVSALDNACHIMDDRYKQIRKGKDNFPRLVIVIDELADLMLTSQKLVEPAIVRIAQLGRAAGIHLILATQRPVVKVVTGLIKANITSRIALTTASQLDSRVIIDMPGAEKLTGQGDALLSTPKYLKPLRFQGAWISPKDTADIVNYWKSPEARRKIK